MEFEGKLTGFRGKSHGMLGDRAPKVISLGALASFKGSARTRGIINQKVDLRAIVERFRAQNVAVFAAKLSERSKGAQVKHSLNPEDHSKTRLKNAAINFETKECLEWPSRACSMTSRVW